jgi:hypothetical protein
LFSATLEKSDVNDVNYAARLVGLFISTTGATLICVDGAARGGPRTSLIAQPEQNIGQTAPGAAGGPSASQTMEAQLRNQQTPARWKMPSANADTISWNDYPTRSYVPRRRHQDKKSSLVPKADY